MPRTRLIPLSCAALVALSSAQTAHASSSRRPLCEVSEAQQARQDRRRARRNLNQLGVPPLANFFIPPGALRSTGPFVVDLYDLDRAFEPTTTGNGLVLDARPWALNLGENVEAGPGQAGTNFEDEMLNNGWRIKQIEGQQFGVLGSGLMKQGLFVADDDSAYPRKYTLTDLRGDGRPDVGQGYRPIAIGFNSTAAHAISWIKDNKNIQSEIVGPMDIDDYRVESEEMMNKGMRPISVDIERTMSPADEEQVVAIWVDDGIGPDQWRHEPQIVGLSELISITTQNLQDGFYPFQIASSQGPVDEWEPSFSVIYAERPYGLRIRTAGGTTEELHELDADQRQDGYHLLTATRYMDPDDVDLTTQEGLNDSIRYVGVWGKYDFVPRVTGSDVRNPNGTINILRFLAWSFLYKPYEHLAWNALTPGTAAPTPFGEWLFQPANKVIPAGTLNLYSGKDKVWERGFTFAPAVYPTFEPDARMPVGSVAKSITAIAALKAVRNDDMSLESRIDEELNLRLDHLPPEYEQHDTLLSNLQHLQNWHRRPDLSDRSVDEISQDPDNIDVDAFSTDDSPLTAMGHLRFRNQIALKLTDGATTPESCDLDEDCPEDHLCDASLNLCAPEDATPCESDEECPENFVCNSALVCVEVGTYWQSMGTDPDYRYCNSCFSAIGEAVRSYTDSPTFWSFVRDEVLAPLGVEDLVQPMRRRRLALGNEAPEPVFASGTRYLSEPGHDYRSGDVETKSSGGFAPGLSVNRMLAEVGADYGPTLTTGPYGATQDMNERWLAAGGFVANADGLFELFHDSLPNGDHQILGSELAYAIVDPTRRVAQSVWQLGGGFSRYGLGFFALKNWYIATGAAAGGSGLVAHNRHADFTWALILNRGSSRPNSAFADGWSYYNPNGGLSGFLSSPPYHCPINFGTPDEPIDEECSVDVTDN